MNKNNKNILSVVEPPITSYPSIANVFSLLWVDKDSVFPWFCDHFIQLVVRPNHDNTFSDFYEHADIDNYYRMLYGASGLGWMRVNSNCVPFKAFTDYIEYMIDNGYGVEACLDRYYLSFAVEYGKEHFTHSSFIYGYDREKKEIYVADFWKNDYGKYKTQIASYEDINASMNNDYIINLFKPQESDYVFNKELMKRYFEDYYNSQDSFSKFEYSYQSYNKGVILGLNIYDYILDNFKENEMRDIRDFQVLYDHKALMKLRLEYLTKLGEFDGEKLQSLSIANDELLRKSRKLRDCVIKYDMKYSERLYGQIREMIIELKKMDEEFVKGMIAL